VLDRYLVDVEEVNKELKLLHSFLSSEKYINKAETIGKQIESIISEQELLSEALEIAEEVEELKKGLAAEKPIKEALQITKEIDQLILLENLLETFVGLDTDIAKLEVSKDEIKEEYVLELTELKVCPTCFSVIDEKRINSIIEEL